MNKSGISVLLYIMLFLKGKSASWYSSAAPHGILTRLCPSAARRSATAFSTRTSSVHTSSSTKVVYFTRGLRQHAGMIDSGGPTDTMRSFPFQ